MAAGKCPIGCQWVITLKYKLDGIITNYKAWPVAKKFTQEYGEDYLKIFSSPAAEL